MELWLRQTKQLLSLNQRFMDLQNENLRQSSKKTERLELKKYKNHLILILHLIFMNTKLPHVEF